MTRGHALVLSLALACACVDELGPDEHGHDTKPAVQDHDHGLAPESEAVTRWGATTQLFVKFPPLVVGEDSLFAAHLTRLEDHAPIDSGTVIVELSGGDQPAEQFRVRAPSVAGVFLPIVKPSHAGLRRLTIHLESSMASETHQLGEFTVLPSRVAANAADAALSVGSGGGEEPSEASDDQRRLEAQTNPRGTISYRLEQQWQVPFGLAAVETRELRPNLSALARLSTPPEAQVSVTAPRKGWINLVGEHVPHVGEHVDANQILFELGTKPKTRVDPASLDLAISQASTEVQAAQREVRRLAPLVAQGEVDQRSLDDANAALWLAKATLDSARQHKRSLSPSQVGGHGMAIASPIDGTIAELLIAPGTLVREGQALARLVDRGQLWLDVGVPEAHVAALGQISGAWFQLDGEQVLELPAEALVSVGTEIDPRTRTLPVRFRVDNVGHRLYAGMTTQAHVIIDRPHTATAVPVTALLEDAGAEVVYVQIDGESFERRLVSPGVRDGAWIEILSGLSPGEWVVARGAYSIKLAANSTAALDHGHTQPLPR